MNRQIPFADLKSQYNAYKEELDKAVLDVMGSSMHILNQHNLLSFFLIFQLLDKVFLKV